MGDRRSSQHEVASGGVGAAGISRAEGQSYDHFMGLREEGSQTDLGVGQEAPELEHVACLANKPPLAREVVGAARTAGRSARRGRSILEGMKERERVARCCVEIRTEGRRS